MWSSFGSIAPDVHPEWIRIDLPIESTVASVALVLSKTFQPGSSFGRSLPKELTIKSSRDGWHWDTVYDNKDVDINTPDTLEIKFAPHLAKQILGHGESLYETDVQRQQRASILNWRTGSPRSQGKQLALLSRGAGVTVSSTHYTDADNRLTQNTLWAPLQYDMGMKWLRTMGGLGGVGGARGLGDVDLTLPMANHRKREGPI